MAVVVDFRNFDKLVLNIKKLNSSRVMGLIGEAVIELNEDQIADQKDRDNRKYIPYSARYQRQRKKAGRDSRVDLTGISNPTMLRNFGVTNVKKGKVSIGFSSITEKVKALGVMSNPKRPVFFVGLHKKSIKKLNDFIFRKFVKV